MVEFFWLAPFTTTFKFIEFVSCFLYSFGPDEYKAAINTFFAWQKSQFQFFFLQHVEIQTTVHFYQEDTFIVTWSSEGCGKISLTSTLCFCLDRIVALRVLTLRRTTAAWLVVNVAVKPWISSSVNSLPP